MMRYLSVCSGIEAATVAWPGWTPVAFSEIAKAPSRLLAHHYPDVPNLGDMTKYLEWPDLGTIDILAGGTPCQSFSIAGRRDGLDDPRGKLMLAYVGIARRYRPRWLVWENVPGVLSSNRGRDFGTLLGALGECGYGFAYRILDAQYFRVAQRRRRVFVVGYFGDWRRAAAVLFDSKSLSGHPAPRRETGQVAPTLPARSTGGGGLGTDFDLDGGLITMAHGQGGAEVARGMCATLTCNHEAQIVAFPARLSGTQSATTEHVSPTICATNPMALARRYGGVTSVRRFTPRECERLQGFPDEYTNAAGLSDTARYAAIGNSWAVPVARWIGARIAFVDQIGEPE